jgi:hypothetical protein
MEPVEATTPVGSTTEKPVQAAQNAASANSDPPQNPPSASDVKETAEPKPPAIKAKKTAKKAGKAAAAVQASAKKAPARKAAAAPPAPAPPVVPAAADPPKGPSKKTQKKKEKKQQEKEELERLRALVVQPAVLNVKVAGKRKWSDEGAQEDWSKVLRSYMSQVRIPVDKTVSPAVVEALGIPVVVTDKASVGGFNPHGPEAAMRRAATIYCILKICEDLLIDGIDFFFGNKRDGMFLDDLNKFLSKEGWESVPYHICGEGYTAKDLDRRPLISEKKYSVALIVDVYALGSRAMTPRNLEQLGYRSVIWLGHCFNGAFGTLVNSAWIRREGKICWVADSTAISYAAHDPCDSMMRAEVFEASRDARLQGHYREIRYWKLNEQTVWYRAWLLTVSEDNLPVGVENSALERETTMEVLLKDYHRSTAHKLLSVCGVNAEKVLKGWAQVLPEAFFPRRKVALLVEHVAVLSGSLADRSHNEFSMKSLIKEAVELVSKGPLRLLRQVYFKHFETYALDLAVYVNEMSADQKRRVLGSSALYGLKFEEANAAFKDARLEEPESSVTPLVGGLMAAAGVFAAIAYWPQLSRLLRRWQVLPASVLRTLGTDLVVSPVVEEGFKALWKRFLPFKSIASLLCGVGDCCASGHWTSLIGQTLIHDSFSDLTFPKAVVAHVAHNGGAWIWKTMTGILSAYNPTVASAWVLCMGVGRSIPYWNRFTPFGAVAGMTNWKWNVGGLSNDILALVSALPFTVPMGSGKPIYLAASTIIGSVLAMRNPNEPCVIDDEAILIAPMPESVREEPAQDFYPRVPPKDDTILVKGSFRGPRADQLHREVGYYRAFGVNTPMYAPAHTVQNLQAMLETRLLAKIPHPIPLNTTRYDELVDYFLAAINPTGGVLRAEVPTLVHDELNDELFNIWLEHTDPSKRSVYKAAFEQVRQVPLTIDSPVVNRVQVNCKCDEVLLKAFANGTSTSPRPIHAVDPKLAVWLGPRVYAATEYWKAALDCTKVGTVGVVRLPIYVTLGLGLTDVELSGWYKYARTLRGTHIINAGDDVLVVVNTGFTYEIIEADVSKCDHSMRLPMLRAEYSLLAHAGLKEDTLDFLRVNAAAALVVCRRTRKDFGQKVVYRQAERNTGGTDTSIGNSLVIMLVVWWAAISDRLQDLEAVAAELGFAIKVRRRGGDQSQHGVRYWPGTFLKGTWYKRGDEWFWGPLLSRLVKISKTMSDPRRVYASAGCTTYEEAAACHLRAVAKTLLAGAMIPEVSAWLRSFADWDVRPAVEDLVADHKVALTAGVTVDACYEQLSDWYGRTPEFWADFLAFLQKVRPGDFALHPAWHILATRDYA